MEQVNKNCDRDPSTVQRALKCYSDEGDLLFSESYIREAIAAEEVEAKKEAQGMFRHLWKWDDVKTPIRPELGAEKQAHFL